MRSKCTLISIVKIAMAARDANIVANDGNFVSVLFSQFNHHPTLVHSFASDSLPECLSGAGYSAARGRQR